jgi:CTD kinase subunit gamma
MPEDIEFENAWETTSDWNEDDDEAVLEENELCEGGAGLGANDMDTSQ